MKMLAADAEKRMSGAAGGAAAAAAKLEIARSGPRREIQIQVSSAFGSGSDNINSIGVVPEEDSAEVGGGGSNGHGGGGGLRVAGVSSAASSSSVGGSGGGITSRIQTYNSQPAHSFTTATANSTDGVLHLNNNPLANSTPVVRISDENPVGITLEHSSPPSSKYSPSSSSSAKKDSPQTQQPTTIQLPSLPLQVLPTEEDVAQPLGKDDDVEVNQIIAKSVADKPEPQQIAVATPNEGEGEAAAEEQQNSTKEQIIDLRQASNTKQQEGPQEDPAVNPSSHIAPPASPPTTLPSELDTSPYNMAQTECSSSDTHEHSQNGDSHDVQSPNTGVSFDSDNGSSIYEPSCGLQRRCSVFSLSRVSFSSQLSRLTSLALPLSDEFAEKIKIMKTGVEVSNAITSNAKQILRWIDTAKSVLKNLDSEDDVEWAAQGKQSLSEVDTAVHKFSSLMQVYVAAIDQLQARPDAPTVGDTIFKDILTTMEVILEGWDKIQALLKGVKCQVETAMEWNELWTTILQDIQAELEACQTIVFEIEEQRHRSMMEDSDSSNGLMDIETLATIIEEKPGNRTVPAKEDASLLGLFARMQPLRASLDFLPMRLASFQSRAEEIFPSACQDLDIRNNALEKKWKKLNCDAEEMRRELGEDKWVAIFRNAGKQASKMIASVERSLNKLKEAVQQYREGADMTDLALNKKIENYEAKRLHYGKPSFALVRATEAYMDPKALLSNASLTLSIRVLMSG